ncbi:MAG: DNA polymerase III subunit gamma/tau [Clostridia bacterium]|nr:DNA polymerase III subunit gamma/tau [Clostridia bacterium]
MAYLAFYRMFRPDTLDKVVRQEHIVKILKNQIESGKIGHAYLFCGPRGTGKTSVAKIFARAINCEHPVNGSPCGECETCRAIGKGGNLDISEIDAASNNGVDEMRDLREKVQYPPVAGKYKVYIIDEVHMLTASAFNAVLKTLEEPPAHAVFILATTEPQKIPATILSRCMRFDFKLIPQADLEGLLNGILQKIGKEYEDEAVSAIARAGAGSARDTLSIADMCVSYSSGKLTYSDVNAVLGSADFFEIARAVDCILADNAQDALSEVEKILAGGKGVGVLVKDILNYLNNAAIVKMCKDSRQILNLPSERYDSLKKSASADGHKILRCTEILAKAESDMRYASDGRITLETAVLKCSLPQSDYNIDALISRISAVELKISQGNFAVKPQENTPSAEAKTETRVPLQEPFRAEEKREEKPAEKLEEKPAERPAEKPEEKPEELHYSFKKQRPTARPPLWNGEEADVFGGSGSSSARPKSADGGLLGKLLKALRTTNKNAVLFTLCMDLSTSFEGDKLILTTESDTVYKGLTRADNNKFLSETLLSLGVTGFEIRSGKKQNNVAQAIDKLKSNFEGTDIDIK